MIGQRLSIFRQAKYEVRAFPFPTELVATLYVLISRLNKIRKVDICLRLTIGPGELTRLA
jgi:hypothetical protein